MQAPLVIIYGNIEYANFPVHRASKLNFRYDNIGCALV